MRSMKWRLLWNFLRQQAATFFIFQHSDRPWQLPAAAAIACGFPMVVGAIAGLPRAGALGAMAGLSFLYLPPVRPEQGIPIVMAAAFGIVSSYAIGLVGSAFPDAAAVLIGCVAAAAMLFCKTQRLAPPGPLFMVISASIGAFTPVTLLGAMENIGFFTVRCIWAGAVAAAYSVCICPS